MDKPPGNAPVKRVSAEDRRNARLAEQLRTNLQKRKAQARSRRDGEADKRPDGLATGKPGAGEQKPGR